MQRCVCRKAVIGMVGAILFFAALQVRGEEPKVEKLSVSKTYNNAPFEYQIRPLTERAGFQVYRLTYPSPVVTPVESNNTIPADYYLPKSVQPGAAKYPAVICLHILNGDEQLTDLVCSSLATRGIPAISFKLPYYGSRGLSGGPDNLAKDPKMFATAIGQAIEDIRRTVDLLASRPEINPERIGITGISLGGITAATAAGAEPRLYRTSLMLAGGDLMKIILHARETRLLKEMLEKLSPQERAAVESKVAAVDPVRLAPGLRERAQAGRVLMINAGEDEVIPHACTEKLAEALGIADHVSWFEGLGHYTAMAELPRALRMSADFFAQDLPAEAKAATPQPAAVESTATQRLVALVEQIVTMLTTEPGKGRCHFVDLDWSATLPNGKTISNQVRFIRGSEGRFSLRCDLPEVGMVTLGQNGNPWIVAGTKDKKTLFVGAKNPVAKNNALSFVEPQHLMKLRMAAGIGGGIIMTPAVLQQWVAVENNKPTAGASEKSAADSRTIRITAKEKKFAGDVQLSFADDNRTPTSATFTAAGVQGKVRFRGWQMNTIAPAALFDPPEGFQRQEVDQSDLLRMFASVANFAAERFDVGRKADRAGKSDPIAVVARDKEGHGLLCNTQGKYILMVSGTPEQMGAAQGALLGSMMKKLVERTVYLVGTADTFRTGVWFFDRMADIERHTLPHMPPRFMAECDALSKAVGIAQRDGRYANLFPEEFHCSGVAVRGKASAGGKVIHARVLDYMRDIDLQQAAVVQVFMPEGRNKWISHGYAGFVGTVTAMNEKGLAIGEMGGRGEGQWDGVPMSFLLRDVMERAATVDEATAILKTSPRTCEYYYVISDRTGAIRSAYCTPQKMLTLEAGEQHPLLPPVPEDSVLISGGDHAKALSRQLQENYGKIDVPKLIEIIKQGVAMKSNLHDAIFLPETLDMWFADAGKSTPASEEPYAHVNLRELIQFYGEQGKSEPKK